MGSQEWWMRTFAPETGTMGDLFGGEWSVGAGEKKRQQSTKENEAMAGKPRASGAGSVDPESETYETNAVAKRRTRTGGRTKTIYTNSLGLGGMADISRKTLLGQ